MKKLTSLTGLALLLFTACAQSENPSQHTNNMNEEMKPTVIKSDEEWKKSLSPEAYNVLRQHGTERAFTGAFWDHHDQGMYTCAGCGQPLFDSETKFDSGTGWPSYYAPAADSSVVELKDMSHGMVRTEVMCARCGGHLGHVFPDGPKPTGMRYCINSAALSFKEEK